MSEYDSDSGRPESEEADAGPDQESVSVKVDFGPTIAIIFEAIRQQSRLMRLGEFVHTWRFALIVVVGLGTATVIQLATYMHPFVAMTALTGWFLTILGLLLSMTTYVLTRVSVVKIVQVVLPILQAAAQKAAENALGALHPQAEAVAHHTISAVLSQKLPGALIYPVRGDEVSGLHQLVITALCPAHLAAATACTLGETGECAHMTDHSTLQ